MISRRKMIGFGAAAVAGVGGVFAAASLRKRAALGSARALYDTALTPPDGAQNVYHLGHSLVGRDMPAMLAQLAPGGHDYASQLGWGTPLRSHYEPDVEINGFETENAHAKFAPAIESLQSGDFDAFVMTEMVELKDAIKYHESADYLAKWAQLARRGRGDVRLYLYETWHHIDDPAGFYDRLHQDFVDLWLNKVALPAASQIDAPIYVIPGGQVLASVGYTLDVSDGIGNVANLEALMARTPEGEVDTIHLGDLGNYLIALTHYATIYQRDPRGLRFALRRADGTPADAPDAEAAAMMQQIVWDTVRNMRPFSGLSV